MLLKVFGTFASAEKEIEKITKQITVGITFGGNTITKLIINKLAKSRVLKFIVGVKNSCKRSDVFGNFL